MHIEVLHKINAGSDNHNILVMENKSYQCVVVSSEMMDENHACHPIES